MTLISLSVTGAARDVQRRVARHLAAAGIASAALEARLLTSRAAGCTPLDLLAGRAPPLTGDAGAWLAAAVGRRLRGEPIAYILGMREFWSLPLTVTPAVLIPRADSETLVEAALVAFAGPEAPRTLVDLGTGSGCLLLALLSEWRQTTGVGIDISPAALAVARGNAVALGMASRALFACGDWGDALPDRAFDVVVSNPPYVSDRELAALDRGIRLFEPQLALAAGSDGLAAYRRLLPAISRLLAEDGLAFVEISPTRLADLPALIAAAGLTIVVVKPDLAGNPRCLVLSRKKSAWKASCSRLGSRYGVVVPLSRTPWRR